ncbi:hypothetical protein DH2020_035020 [Rehmannia glutinosa]|uniref:CCHC-type domain-containing protein n=1 Tax=Rehmannia glutinosa TaxID=99300 RepID=A0ABR0VAK3_REHGL
MDEKKYVTTSIDSVMSKITDHKLNRSNYLDWTKTIRLYLRSISMDQHLTEDPPTDDSKVTWLRDDARLFLQIRNSIDSDVVGMINHCEFVKELMDYLAFVYSGGNIRRMYDVCQAFYRAEKGERSLTDYFMDFKKTHEELNLLFPFSTDVKAQAAQREKMAVMSFLTGLPSEFETAKSQILSSPEISSLQEVFSRILRNEKSTPISTHNAFVSHTSDSKKPMYKNGNPGRNFPQNVGPRGPDLSHILCRYCHEPGHFKKDCPKLQRKNRFSHSTHLASANAPLESVLISADDYAKFSQYQETLKSSSSSITAIADSGKPQACLISSSSKWVIDSVQPITFSGSYDEEDYW